MDEPHDLPPDPEPTPATEPPAEPAAAAPEPAPEPALLPAPESAPEPALLPAPEPAPEPVLLPAPEPQAERDGGPEAEHEPEHRPEEPLPEEPPHATAEAVHPDHEPQALENAQRLESEIEALRTGHVEDGQRQFRTFFEHERRLHTLFKELRPLHPHDRHRLWKVLKQMGADARRAQQEEWESRRYQSIEARETVEEKLRAAEALTQAAQDGTAYRRAESMLNEIRNLLSGAAPGTPGQQLIGPDRRACWDHWRTAREALRRLHGGRQEQAHREMAELVAAVAAQAAAGDPFHVTQRIKELQARLGKADLRRGQFEELRKRLSAAWQQAQGRMVEQRRERAQHRAEWRGRMEQHLARWRETLVQKRGQLEHLVEQAAKLIEMERRARSEDFAEQVRQWQASTAEKRRRTEESIAELEERIRDAEKRAGVRGRANAPAAPGRKTKRRARAAAAAGTPADEAPASPPVEAPASPPAEAPASPPDEAPASPPDEATAPPPDEAPAPPPNDTPAPPPDETPAGS